MGAAGRLGELLDDVESSVYAFDPLGASALPVPDALGVPADRQLVADGPLDLLDTASHGSAVVAFEHARRQGHGSADVRLDITGRHCWLEIFDLAGEHGCFLAVLVPHDPTAELQRSPTTLAPRRAAYDLGVSGVIERIDPGFTSMLGWSEDELVGESSLSIIHPDDHEAGIVAWVELLEQVGNMTRLRQRFRRRDGSWLWCECTDYNELDDPDRPRVLGELIDISREVAAEQELQRRETMLDRLYRALPTGVVVLCEDGEVGAINERWLELVGGSAAAPLESLLDVVADRDAVTQVINDAIDDGVDGDLEVRIGSADDPGFGNLHVRPIVEGGQHVALMMTFDDTTERRLYERELAVQMRRDPLTGVLNRRGVEEQLRERLDGDPVAPLTVLYLDIDDFKSVNDRWGHAAGDELLCAVAACVADDLGEGDVVGRIGGDEFLVIVDGPPSDAERIAARVERNVQRLAERLPVTEDFGLSIGCAHRHPGDDFDSIVGRADASMYVVKAERWRSATRDRRRLPQSAAIG